MIDNGQALELIEQAQSERPFCACGDQTVPVGRGGGVWLECRSLQERPRNLVRRIFAAALGIHTRDLIVELGPAGPALA